jgi:hypothetical protein
MVNEHEKTGGEETENTRTEGTREVKCQFCRCIVRLTFALNRAPSWLERLFLHVFHRLRRAREGLGGVSQEFPGYHWAMEARAMQSGT